MSLRLNTLGPGIVAALFLGLLAANARAEIKLPSILASHMVLQRDVACPIWGWGASGEQVTVEFAGQKQSATADADGKWIIRLQALKTSAKPQIMTIRGNNTLSLEDVLVGEVWLCGGQSNMELTVAEAANAKDEIAAANYPRIRFIKVPHAPAFQPQNDVPTDGWKACTPKTAPKCTAAGYYFGRKLMQDLDVPVGLIDDNWGGTRIEPWTPGVGFQQVPALKNIADKLDTFPSKIEHYHQTPLALYNGMIHPLLPFAIRGVIWYQGESNNEGAIYFEKMKALIGGWRAVWNNPEMPFYFVQLAPFKNAGDPTRLAETWEAQTAALSIPHTGMVVTVDIGNVKNIHPKNKQEVGRRLALWALAKTYDKQGLVYSGPMYREMKIEGNKIRLSFDHIGGGLISRDGKPLTWFSIAGKDNHFVDAQAQIEGDTVVVFSDQVAEPKAVRFGWNQEAEPNLSNKEGLPASPFRTSK